MGEGTSRCPPTSGRGSTPVRSAARHDPQQPVVDLVGRPGHLDGQRPRSSGSRRWSRASCSTRRRRACAWTASGAPTRTTPKCRRLRLRLAQMGPMFGHTGELGGYNSFMGHDPVNDVTIVAWGNLAPTADGKGPAAYLVRELVPFVYAMPAKGETDDIDEASAAE